jgi:tRNA modification GTPase
LIASMEAGIDFAEDDIDVMESQRIATQIAALRAPLEELERSFAYGRVVRDGFRLAIVGRPNAGKSSLFNRLVQRDRAIVTASPGTTRDTVSERVAIDGIPVDLIDTAGLREAADEAERMGIVRSREAMAEADLVLLVVDATVGETEEDRAVLAQNNNGTHGVIVAWNKSDLQVGGLGDAKRDADPSATLRDDRRVEISVVRTSALSGEGIAELRATILQTVAGKGGGLRESGLLTNLRQHQAVEQALGGLVAAQAAVARGIPHEMLLLDLYEALRGLGVLSGATTNEDVLRLIFSRFCIGK